MAFSQGLMVYFWISAREVHLEEDGLEDALFSQLQQLLLAAQLPSPLQVLLLTLYVPALAGEELPHVFHTTT